MSARIGSMAIALALGIGYGSAASAAVPVSKGAASSSASQRLPDAPGTQVLQDAVASVVVVALTEEFDGKAVAVSIDSYEVEVVGARQRIVTGRGSVDVGGDASDELGFRYRTLYDVVSDSAGYPAITLLGTQEGGERSVPNDAGLIADLDRHVAAQLARELGDQQVWLQLDRIESFESGGRYVRIDAEGLVDFGLDGSAPARVDALYDRAESAWLRVRYDLGRTATDRVAVGSGG